MAHEIILHHYDTSPFSEKPRVMFGVKGLAWRAVTQPVIMPKPELTPLTGGYRRIPVMQIGADVYCDTQVMLAEIEARHPDPPVVRGGAACRPGGGPREPPGPGARRGRGPGARFSGGGARGRLRTRPDRGRAGGGHARAGGYRPRGPGGGPGPCAFPPRRLSAERRL